MLLSTVLGLGCTGTIAAPPPAAGGGTTGNTGATGGSTGGTSGAPRAGAGGTNGTGGSSTGASGGATSPPSLADAAGEYFPGQTAAGASKRVFRLTRTQLDITTRTLLPELFEATAMASLPSDPLQTNYEYADNLGFNAANFTPFTNWIAEIAAAAEAAPETVIDCAENDAACLGDEARAFVSRAFRGAATDAQIARFADFFVADVASVGLPEATGTLVDLVLTSPHYVFRDEVLTGTDSALLPAQQLQNITYTLADAPPETLGLSSASPGEHLGTAAQETIDRILESPEAHDKLMRFVWAWLEVKEPDAFTIAESAFPEFTEEVAAAVVEETRSFLERELAKAVPSLRDVLESNQTSISSEGAFLYDSATSGSGDLDPAQRLGIFTQPAVLASHSGPTTSRLVKRGVFFVRKVMCMPLGSPPDDVDTTLPTEGATERERIEAATAPPKCAGCHAFINPFGFVLENYDAIGRWRTDDEGEPIDANIEVDFLDEGPFSTDSPVEALRTFTRSWRFQQCFARQLFRYYVGRDETTVDDPVLRRMFEEFAVDGDQNMLGMLRTLASSTTFSQRTESP
ncbi:MAG TPA: DUF1588 domain-containing protein [Polyangiaceae bacterium]